jgi:hypothetical protein
MGFSPHSIVTGDETWVFITLLKFDDDDEVEKESRR